jgi:hypothetical protein
MAMPWVAQQITCLPRQLFQSKSIRIAKAEATQ